MLGHPLLKFLYATCLPASEIRALSVTLFASVTSFACLLCAGLSMASGQTSFGTISLGSSSGVQTITLTVPAADILTGVSVVTQGAMNQDFVNVGGGTCTVGNAYAASCTVQVKFSPKFSGSRAGVIVLTDSKGVVGTTYLKGNGPGPQLGFGFTGNVPKDAGANYIINLPVTFTFALTPNARTVAANGTGTATAGSLQQTATFTLYTP